MKLASLVSGGKDSLYAMYLERKKGNKIMTMISFDSENKESYMFHIPNIHLMKTISGIIGLELMIMKTKGVKEEELADIESVIRKAKEYYSIEGVTTGAVASNYQKNRIDKICESLGIKSIAPFWGRNQEEVLREMVDCGFKAIIVSVGAPPLDDKWLGRIIDKDCINELVEMNRKAGVNIMGEGGEYCTLVLDCPLYSHTIEIEDAAKEYDPETKSGFYFVKKLRLLEKESS